MPSLAKRAPFVPLDTTRWIADRYDLIGPEWPLALAVADLRFWDSTKAPHGVEPTPSLREFADVWGWSKSRVARLVSNRPRWQDTGNPARGRLGSIRSVGQARDTGGTPAKGLRVITGGSRDTGGTPVGRKDPPLDTRARTPRHLDTQTTSEETNTSDNREPEDPWDVAHAAYLNAQFVLGRRKRSLSKSRGLGAMLAKAVAEYGGDEVASVITWWATSNHDRAEFLRGKGFGLDTLLRPSKFEGYLAMVDAPDLGVKPGHGAFYDLAQPRQEQVDEPKTGPESEVF